MHWERQHVHAPASASTRSNAGAHDVVARVLLLLVCGLAFEVVALGLWPVSYDLTQGPDFSYEYLLQYPQVWDIFRPILQRFEQVFPTAATSLELLTALLSLFWVASFLIYLGAFVLVRALPQRWWLGALIVGMALLFQATFFLMPGIFTTDLFSYVMYGYIPRVYDLNPYIYVPGYFPNNRMTSWIHPIWYYTPSIYGPIWVDLSAWLTGFTRDRSLVDQALAYRLVSNVAHLVNLGLFGLLLRRLAPPRPLSLLLLFAWNPLLLFEFAASGHNDSTMLVFVLLGCLLLLYRRYVLAVVALSAAVLVKLTPILVLPLVAVHWARRQRTWRARLGVVMATGLIFIVVGVAFYLPWYSGPDTFQLIAYWSRGPMYLNYVPDLAALTIADQLLDPARLDQQAAWETARTWIKWITRVAFGVYFLWELFRVPGRRDLLAAMTRVFLVFLLVVNTWVLPWYLTWPLVLALPLGWERLETRIMVGFSLTAPLMMYNHHYWSIHMTPWLYAVYLAPLLLGLPALRRWIQAERRRPARPVGQEDHWTAAVSS